MKPTSPSSFGSFPYNVVKNERAIRSLFLEQLSTSTHCWCCPSFLYVLCTVCRMLSTSSYLLGSGFIFCHLCYAAHSFFRVVEGGSFFVCSRSIPAADPATIVRDSGIMFLYGVAIISVCKLIALWPFCHCVSNPRKWRFIFLRGWKLTWIWIDVMSADSLLTSYLLEGRASMLMGQTHTKHSCDMAIRVSNSLLSNNNATAQMFGQLHMPLSRTFISFSMPHWTSIPRTQVVCKLAALLSLRRILLLLRHYCCL